MDLFKLIIPQVTVLGNTKITKTTNAKQSSKLTHPHVLLYATRMTVLHFSVKQVISYFCHLVQSMATRHLHRAGHTIKSIILWDLRVLRGPCPDCPMKNCMKKDLETHFKYRILQGTLKRYFFVMRNQMVLKGYGGMSDQSFVAMLAA